MHNTPQQINIFSEAFKSYVCIGDTIIAEKDGFVIEARIERDDSVRKPGDRDDYFNPQTRHFNTTEEYDIAVKEVKSVLRAWENDEWFYCGIELSVSKKVNVKGRTQSEVQISSHAASLWGIEANYPGSDNAYLTTVANELAGEALDFAKELLRQLNP